MRPMKLGTQALPPTEVAFVRMLLRLYGNNGHCQWTFTDAPPYDALLVDESEFDIHNSLQVGMEARRVRRIARGHTDRDVMQRPLNAGQLRNWLDEVEQSLPAASYTAPSGPDIRFPPPETAATTPQSASEAPSLPPEGGPRFRLKRWPHQILLRKDPARIRIATLLSRRALNARDLVMLTGLDPQRCLVFLQVLQASSLLVPAPPERSDITDNNHLASTHSLKHPTNAKTGLTRGLISGLRKRLGL